MSRGIDHYEILCEVGQGAFGRVFRAKFRPNLMDSTTEPVAIKIIECKKEIDFSCGHNFEIFALRNHYHENIVNPRDAFLVKGSPGNVYKVHIVFELMDTNLGTFLDENYPEGLSEELIRRYTQQMLRGLDFLHDRNILHRDVKPENLLLDLKSNTLKLSDFGSARSVFGKSNISLCMIISIGNSKSIGR